MHVRLHLREACLLEKGWIFCKFLALDNDNYGKGVQFWSKKIVENIARQRGGGVQRSFGNFPEIHPLWTRQASQSNQVRQENEITVWCILSHIGVMKVPWAVQILWRFTTIDRDWTRFFKVFILDVMGGGEIAIFIRVTKLKSDRCRGAIKLRDSFQSLSESF